MKALSALALLTLTACAVHPIRETGEHEGQPERTVLVFCVFSKCEVRQGVKDAAE